jgi:dTDP-4-amino-4,6-dideoxygalactose transaminase
MDLAITGAAPCISPGTHSRWPEITEADDQAVSAALHGELSGTTAKPITNLEAAWAAYCPVDYVLATASGTAALHMALVAGGVKPGDHVITSGYSFAASGMAILQANAKAVFAEIDQRTYNLDPAHVAALVGPRTTAILAVHIHGLPADMRALRAIAARHNLLLIEDAAEAAGALYHGRKAATLADGSGVSNNVSKVVPGGDGGLYGTGDQHAYKAAARMRVFGEDTPALGPNQIRAFQSYGTGYQYRPAVLHAALVGSQLTRLDDYLARARANARILTAGLSGLPGITPPYIPPGLESAWWKYAIRLSPEQFGWTGSDPEFRDRFISALLAEGVIAGTWQRRPLPALPAFRRATPGPWRHGDPDPLPWEPEDFPVTSATLRNLVMLTSEAYPLYVQTPELMHRYVDAVRRVVTGISTVLTAPYQPLEEVPAVGDGW